MELSEGNPNEQTLQNRKICKNGIGIVLSISQLTILSLIEDECLWDIMMHLMSDESPSNKFFKTKENSLLNMQDNIQARKCKIPIEESNKNMVSMEKDDNQCQDR
jgi:hypothetical protein